MQFGQVQDLLTTLLNAMWFMVPILILMDSIGIALVIAFIYFIDKKKSPLKELGLLPVKGAIKSFSKGASLSIVISIGIVACLLVFGLSRFVSTGFSSYGTTAVAISVIAFLITDLVVAFFEEMFFRGYIQRLLVDNYSVAVGLVGASIIFALFHLPNDFRLAPILTIFLAGIILGYLYIKSGSLYMSIGFHFTWDFLAMAIFQIGTSTMSMGANPILLFSAPSNVVIDGIDIGGADDCIQMIIVAAMFLAIYVYYRVKEKRAGTKNKSLQELSTHE